MRLSPTQVLRASQVVTDVVRKKQGRPTRAEMKVLVEYARRMNERRVFRAPYNSEVVELVLGSLREMKNATEAALAQMETRGARAVLGALLDAMRGFLDTWHDCTTEDLFGDWPSRRFRPDWDSDPRSQTFFEDLGELRGNVRLMFELLRKLNKRIVAEQLTG